MGRESKSKGLVGMFEEQKTYPLVGSLGVIRESGVREGRGKTEARPCRVMVRQGKLEV